MNLKYFTVNKMRFRSGNEIRNALVHAKDDTLLNDFISGNMEPVIPRYRELLFEFYRHVRANYNTFSMRTRQKLIGVFMRMQEETVVGSQDMLDFAQKNLHS